MANSEEYMDILKNSPECTQTFLTWIKENIQDGIRCTNVGLDPMKCETKSGSNIETNLEVWDQLPSSIRDQWNISTVGDDLDNVSDKDIDPTIDQ